MNEMKVLIKPIMDRATTKRAKDSLSGATAKAPTSRASGAGGMGAGKAIALLGAAVAGIVGILAIAKKLTEASPMLQGILQLFQNALNLFLMPIGNMIAMWLQPLAMSAMRFSMAFNKVFGEKGFWGAMSWALQTVMGAYVKMLIGAYTTLFNALKEVLGKVSEGVGKVATAIGTHIAEVIATLLELPGRIADAITGGAKTAVDRATGGAKTAVDRVTGGAGDLIGQAQGLLPFAKGGIVTGPTPALVGEAGPEAIIPLDKLQQGITIQFNGPVYGMRDFEEQVQRIVSRHGNRRPYA